MLASTADVVASDALASFPFAFAVSLGGEASPAVEVVPLLGFDDGGSCAEPEGLIAFSFLFSSFGGTSSGNEEQAMKNTVKTAARRTMAGQLSPATACEQAG